MHSEQLGKGDAWCRRRVLLVAGTVSTTLAGCTEDQSGDDSNGDGDDGDGPSPGY